VRTIPQQLKALCQLAEDDVQAVVLFGQCQYALVNYPQQEVPERRNSFLKQQGPKESI